MCSIQRYCKGLICNRKVHKADRLASGLFDHTPNLREFVLSFHTLSRLDFAQRLPYMGDISGQRALIHDWGKRCPHLKHVTFKSISLYSWEKAVRPPSEGGTPQWVTIYHEEEVEDWDYTGRDEEI